MSERRERRFTMHGSRLRRLTWGVNRAGSVVPGKEGPIKGSNGVCSNLTGRGPRKEWQVCHYAD